jgi:hypothetical protein
MLSPKINAWSCLMLRIISAWNCPMLRCRGDKIPVHSGTKGTFFGMRRLTIGEAYKFGFQPVFSQPRGETT